MYTERFNYYNGFAVVRPQQSVIVLNTIDTTPVNYKPSGDISHLIKNYRDKGYPLGKTRRGFKKYTMRRLLQALGCKSYKEVMRKSKRRDKQRQASKI